MSERSPLASKISTLDSTSREPSMRTRETVLETFGSRGESVSVQRCRLPEKSTLNARSSAGRSPASRRAQAFDERQQRRISRKLQHVSVALAFDRELIAIEHQSLGPRFDRALLEPARGVIGHHPEGLHRPLEYREKMLLDEVHLAVAARREQAHELLQIVGRGAHDRRRNGEQGGQRQQCRPSRRALQGRPGPPPRSVPPHAPDGSDCPRQKSKKLNQLKGSERQ